MDALPPVRFAVLVSDSPHPCGVESFARRLAAEAGPRAKTLVLGFDTARRIEADDTLQAVVINLPVVAWKRRLIEPIMAALATRRRGLRVVLILHEWVDLDWRRRAAYLPLVAAAQTLLFSSPEIRAQVTSRLPWWVDGAAEAIVPIPPNFERPDRTEAGDKHAAVALARERKVLTIGHFGSIYPKKNPLVVLKVAAALVARGIDTSAVFIGSFIEGQDTIRRDFWEQARLLGLEDRVSVTGYVENEGELFGLIDAVDVFVYAFEEGLTARRSSVFTCLSAGARVVVNAPQSEAAFDDHPTYRDLLSSKQLRLVDTHADVGTIADAVVAMRSEGRAPASSLDVKAVWRTAIDVLDAAMRD